MVDPEWEKLFPSWGERNSGWENRGITIEEPTRDCISIGYAAEGGGHDGRLRMEG